MIPQKVKASETLALIQEIKSMRAKGFNVVSFAAGEPDFDTPGPIVEEAYASLKRGRTRYEPTPGIPELREAVAEDYRSRLNCSWVKAENTLMSAGAKQGIYLVLAGLLEKNDEVLIPSPYWVSYPEVVQAAGGKSIFVDCSEGNDFFPTLESLKKAKTSKTKALIFSSPCNPTGGMIRKDLLGEITRWCVAEKITLIYDELYERLLLDPNKKHFSALEFVDANGAEYVVSVNALSKTSAMTGWRLGFVVSAKGNIDSLAPLQGQMLTALPGFIQEAGVVGLKRAGEFLPKFVEAFRHRKQLVMKGFGEIPGFRCFEPSGGFYLAVNVEGTLKKLGFKTDADFALAVLQKKHVAFLPGSSMGMPGWIRISFPTSDEQISEGIRRIKDFVSGV